MKTVCLLCGLFLLTAIATADERPINKDGTPPKGAPWTKDLVAAQKAALTSGRPMFLYFTKTYCPHCVTFEQNVLTQPALASLYPRVVWVHVFRDFSGSEADRAAERVEFRFGATGYPTHILVDPVTLQELENTSRTVPLFTQAVARAAQQVRPSQNLQPALALQAAEQRAMLLEEKPTVELAKAGLKDGDVAVQLRAIKHLQQAAPEELVSLAIPLLKAPNDQIRYEILDTLVQKPEPRLNSAMLSLLKNPANSRNPNGLRCRIVPALGASGGKESIVPLASYASSGDYFNTLTSASVKALIDIAARDEQLRQPVAEALVHCFPQLKGNTEPDLRYGLGLAKQVHEGLEQVMQRQAEFPASYNQQTRMQLIAAWTTVGGEVFKPTKPTRRKTPRP